MSNNYFRSWRLAFSQSQIARTAIVSLLLVFGLADSMEAQRGARADISTLSTADQNTLAMHIDQWLTQHDDIPDFHDLNFNLGIHWTSNFLPWHRVHVRELEYFLNDEMGWPGLLPGWRPKSTASEPNNFIPVPFRLTYLGTNGTNNNNPIVSIPSQIVFPGACNSNGNADAGTLSDNIEETPFGLPTGYHNRGHNGVGGEMADRDSPAVLIFWPWHAWVDEFWFNWEASCAGEYTKVDLTDNIITINGPDTWAGEHFVKGEVVIESGGVLTIPAGAVIHFRDSDYESYATRIRVKPGGRLVVAGKLTGIDDFGNGGNSGGGSVHYHTGWEGVVVEGTGVQGGNHGRVVLQNNSVIEHAKKGVLSTNGGKVIAVGANFKNCRTGIEIRDYLKTDALFLISGSKFSNDKPLRDVTWESAPINGQIETVNFRHTVTQSTENHIRINNANRVLVMGCTFSNVFEGPDHNSTRGIYATGASQFSCTGGSFTGLFRGIESANPAPGPLGNPNISGVTFNNNGTAILLYGSDYANVSGNTINLGTTTTHEGIAAKASSSFNISSNTFTGAGADVTNGQRAVLIESPGLAVNDFNRIDRNTFTGSPVQIQFQKSVPSVFFSCNNFNGFQRAVALASGSVANQGDCFDKPAGNLWDNLSCIGDESQLFKNATAAPYIYSAHSDRFPACVSAGIFAIDCNVLYNDKPSCQVEPPCDPPCKLTELAALDLAKQQVANGNLPPAEKEAQLAALQTQQKIVAQEGLSAAMASDSTLAAALGFMAAADDFVSFTPAEKIGINLLAGNLAAATNEVNALPVGNEKTLWQLNLTLQTQNRPFALMTAAETQTVETIAQGTDLSAAHAEAILAAAQGKMLSVIAEPLDNSTEGRPSQDREKVASPKNSLAQLNCQPNPSSGAITVSFTLPDGCKMAQFILTDVLGRMVYSNPLEVGMLSGQIGVPGFDLPVGTYFGFLIADGQKMAQSKISIVR